MHAVEGKLYIPKLTMVNTSRMAVSGADISLSYANSVAILEPNKKSLEFNEKIL